MLAEFREFALKGNVIDMAVGVVIGAAFGLIIKSAVDDLIMPAVGMLTGGTDFANMYVLLKPGLKTLPPYETLAAATEAGAVTLRYGVFLNTVINFLIVAFSVFIALRTLIAAKNRVTPKPRVTDAVPPA
ncbi:MAG: large conductance mechanosensitive channel protein MscL [Planctomycetes bacterium]|nr:large conductance mechanosensitive channel protein MscL [Planctomycetota bacterium]